MSEENRLIVNGVEINLLDVGKGDPTLVFLHYWGGSSRTWRPVIAELFTTNRCVAIDFRGWGSSSKNVGSYDLQTLADDVRSVIDRLALEAFVIVGHSMGGKVAQLVAAQQPPKLKQLILVAPAPPRPLHVPEEQRQGMIESYQTREGAEAVIGHLSAAPLSDLYREQVIEDTLCGAPNAKRAWPERGMAEDVSEKTTKIEVPICVIVGSADKIEPEAALRATFEEVHPGAEFIVLPGIGHLAPLEAVAGTVDAIRAGLIAQSASGRSANETLLGEL